MKINEVTKKIEPSKPRNFVAKNMTTSGAGAHRDKKKEQKQGQEKHKNKQYDLSEMGLDEEDQVAGTITSVTPDGKQVTMKKPDGTEVTTDASAFLPGPNNTVTINQPSPGDALKPGTVVQAAPQQGMGEEINDEEDPDLMGSGHNLDVGGDATDDFIDDVRDIEYEKKNRHNALGRIRHLAGLK